MKQIPNFPNYSITEDGRVWSHINNRFLKSNLNSLGYEYVNLNSVSKTIHRLVAITFIENIHNKKEVNHINGIKHDNRVENLEWATKSENERHARNNGLKHYNIEKSNAKIVLDLQTGIFYNSAKDAASSTNYSYLSVLYFLNNKRKNKTSLIYI